MKITVDLKEDIVLELLKLSDSKGKSFDRTVNQLLKEKLIQINRLKGYAPSQSISVPVVYTNMVKLLISRVKELKMGDIFTIKEILLNEWDDIESPRGFGWVAKKVLESNPLVETIKGQGCKKYRRL